MCRPDPTDFGEARIEKKMSDSKDLSAKVRVERCSLFLFVPEQFSPDVSAPGLGVGFFLGAFVFRELELVTEVCLFLVEHKFGGARPALVGSVWVVELAVEAAVQVASACRASFGAGRVALFRDPCGAAVVAEFQWSQSFLGVAQWFGPPRSLYGQWEAFVHKEVRSGGVVAER
jgi:hypothetical protein